MSNFNKNHSSDVVYFAESTSSKGKPYHITSREASVLRKLIHYDINLEKKNRKYITYSNATIAEHLFLEKEDYVRKLINSLYKAGFLSNHNRKYYRDGKNLTNRSMTINWDLFEQIQIDIDLLRKKHITPKKEEVCAEVIQESTPVVNNEEVASQVEDVAKQQEYREVLAVNQETAEPVSDLKECDFDEIERKVIMSKVREFGHEHDEELIFNSVALSDLKGILFGDDGYYSINEKTLVNQHGIRLTVDSPSHYTFQDNKRRKDRMSCRSKDFDAWIAKSSLRMGDIKREHLELMMREGVPKMN